MRRKGGPGGRRCLMRATSPACGAARRMVRWCDNLFSVPQRLRVHERDVVTHAGWPLAPWCASNRVHAGIGAPPPAAPAHAPLAGRWWGVANNSCSSATAKMQHECRAYICRVCVQGFLIRLRHDGVNGSQPHETSAGAAPSRANPLAVGLTRAICVLPWPANWYLFGTCPA